MTVESSLAFAVAMFILAATPGPGVFASVTQALSRGFRSALPVIAGIVIGDLLFVLLAVFGLSAVAHALGELLYIVKIVGGLYLIWLGVNLWRAAPKPLDAPLSNCEKKGWQSLLGGLFITLGNPKVILFYCGFLPTFMDLNSLDSGDIFVVSCVVAVVLSGVMTVYSYFADRARKLFINQTSARNLNRGAGTVLIGTGLVIVSR